MINSDKCCIREINGAEIVYTPETVNWIKVGD